MDQARNGRETAALARRLLCRTLTVLGGAAAGTAIAWFLSTGSAAAEPPADLIGDPAPVLSEAVTPLDGTLDVLAGGLAEPPSTSIQHLGSRLTETAARVDVLPDHGLAGGVAGGISGGITDVVEIVEPVETIETAETADLPAQVDELGPDRPDTGPAPTAPTTGEVIGTGVDPKHTAARSATERAYATGVPHRGSPEPTTPHSPIWPAPFSPNAPVPGHTGHTGTHLADSPPAAALPWRDRAPRPARGLTAPAAEATFSGRAGDQPGIAPD